MYLWNLQFLSKVFVSNSRFSSLGHSWPYSILTIWFYCSQNLLYYLSFQYFDFERTWWGCSRNASFAIHYISTFVFDIEILSWFKKIVFGKPFLIRTKRCGSSDFVIVEYGRPRRALIKYQLLFRWQYDLP